MAHTEIFSWERKLNGESATSLCLLEELSRAGDIYVKTPSDLSLSSQNGH